MAIWCPYTFFFLIKKVEKSKLFVRSRSCLIILNENMAPVAHRGSNALIHDDGNPEIPLGYMVVAALWKDGSKCICIHECRTKATMMINDKIRGVHVQHSNLILSFTIIVYIAFGWWLMCEEHGRIKLRTYYRKHMVAGNIVLLAWSSALLLIKDRNSY